MTALAATASAAPLLQFLLGTVVLLCFVMCTALAQEWKLWKALRGLAPRAAASNSLVNCSRPFVPLVISMPAAWTQYTNAWLRITSDSVSNPEHDVSRTGLGTFAAPYTNALNSSSSRIRLWTRNGGEYRVAQPFPDGDAILSHRWMRASDFAAHPGGKITLYVEALTPSAVLGDVELTVWFYPFEDRNDTSGCCSDTVRMTVFGVEAVHPVAEDFAPGQAGKVMISTKQDADKTAAYHTTAITTADGQRAQHSDAQVTVSAYIKPVPPEGFPMPTVYFEVTDPDDLSHYEEKTNNAILVIPAFFSSTTSLCLRSCFGMRATGPSLPTIRMTSRPLCTTCVRQTYGICRKWTCRDSPQSGQTRTSTDEQKTDNGACMYHGRDSTPCLHRALGPVHPRENH